MVEELLQHGVPMFLALEDFDFNSQVSDWNLLIQEARHADRVFLRRQDAGNPSAGTSPDESINLTLRIAMMVGIALH